MFMVAVIKVNVWVFIRYLYMSVSMWFMGDSASSGPGLVGHGKIVPGGLVRQYISPLLGSS